MLTLPLITVYTQAYNSEKYIRRCIESILNQTYTNFEYFICNHGSTDATEEIIEEYAKVDTRIHSFTMPNSARGFYPEYIKEHAHGQYFVMLDSDDYVNHRYLEKLLNYTIENNLDMTVCGVAAFQNDEMDTDDYRVFRRLPGSICYDIYQNDMYFSGIYSFLRTTWGKIIRMDALRKADFSYYKKNAETFISDDTAFTLGCYAKCRRIGGISDVLQYWRESESSVTAKYKDSLFENNYNIYLETLEMLEEIGDKSLKSIKTAHEVWKGAIVYTFDLLLRSELSDDLKIKEILRIVSTEQFDQLWKTSVKAEVCHNVITWLENVLRHADQLSNETLGNISDIMQKIQSQRLPDKDENMDSINVLIWNYGEKADNVKKVLEAASEYLFNITGLFTNEISEPMFLTDGTVIFDQEYAMTILEKNMIDYFAIDKYDLGAYVSLYGNVSGSIIMTDTIKDSLTKWYPSDPVNKGLIYGTDSNARALGSLLRQSDNAMVIDDIPLDIIGNVDPSMEGGAVMKNGDLYFSLNEAGKLFKKGFISYILIVRESMQGQATLNTISESGIDLHKVYNISLMNTKNDYSPSWECVPESIMFDD